MNIFQTIITHNTTLSAVLTLLLSLWIYNDHRRDPRNIAFGTMLFVVSMWTFSVVLWRTTHDPAQALFWLRTLFFISSLIPLLFLIFAYVFKYGFAPKRSLQMLAIAPNAVLFSVAYLGTTLIEPGQGLKFVMGPGRLIFASHFAIFLLAALLVLYSITRTAQTETRKKLIVLLVGAIISFNSIYGILYGTSFTTAPSTLFIANVGLVIGMIFMSSSLLRQNFLTEVKMLGPQVFVLLVLFVFIFNIVVTEETIDLPLRFVMLVILTSYAALTTRTLLQEVKKMVDAEAMGKQAVDLNRSLIEADKMKTRFVSLASHQLRSPIAGVRLYLEMINKGDFGPVTEEQTKVLGSNLVALTRLGETIETFLDAAKIQLGKLEVYKTEVSLPDLVTQVVAEVAPLAQKKGLKIVAVRSPREIPMVSCDSGKIFHVIANLLDNAIKYTPKGEITVTTETEGGNIVVRISDGGIGLNDDQREHVFEVFKRGMEAVRLDTGGSGLGLYIVKNIIDAHNGQVIVESEGVGKGSTFGIKLPLTA